MRVIISIILMVIAALVGFFFGAGMNEAMGGAILLSMITGFACTINAIEKNKKDWQLQVCLIHAQFNNKFTYQECLRIIRHFHSRCFN